jgi:hypothetical protein
MRSAKDISTVEILRRAPKVTVSSDEDVIAEVAFLVPLTPHTSSGQVDGGFLVAYGVHVRRWTEPIASS